MINALDLFPEVRQVIGAALTTEQQLFVSKNIAHLLAFAGTKDGQSAIRQFVADWQRATTG